MKKPKRESDDYITYKMYEQMVEEWEKANGPVEEPNIIPYEYQEVLKSGNNLKDQEETLCETKPV